MKIWKIPVIMILLLAVLQLVVIPMSAGTYPSWTSSIFIVLALMVLIFGIAVY